MELGRHPVGRTLRRRIARLTHCDDLYGLFVELHELQALVGNEVRRARLADEMAELEEAEGLAESEAERAERAKRFAGMPGPLREAYIAEGLALLVEDLAERGIGFSGE